MTDLTDRQRAVLEFCAETFREQMRMPTFKEVRTHFDMASTNSVSDHFRTLVKKNGSNGIMNPALHVHTDLASWRGVNMVCRSRSSPQALWKLRRWTFQVCTGV